MKGGGVVRFAVGDNVSAPARVYKDKVTAWRPGKVGKVNMETRGVLYRVDFEPSGIRLYGSFGWYWQSDLRKVRT